MPLFINMDSDPNHMLHVTFELLGYNKGIGLSRLAIK